MTNQYFEALSIPLIAGRVFDSDDTDGAQLTVVLDEPLATQVFPDINPVGRRVVVDLGEPRTAEVIGVVGGIQQFTLGGQSSGAMYFANQQLPSATMALTLLAQGDAAGLTSVARQVLGELDAELPYFVNERRRELGVRMALGASGREILALVIRRGMRLVTMGLALGLAAALILGSAVSSLLFGVSRFDPIAFAVVVLLLAGVRLLACFIPARRATRVDPVDVIRAE